MGRRLLHGVHNAMGHRGLRILHTGGWSLAYKACTAANLILCIPFALEALGPSLFGAWATLVSIVAFAGFLDFGLGNGTMNLVASAHARGEDEEVGSIVREGRRALLRIALWLGAAVAVALPLAPWSTLMGLPIEMDGVARGAVAVVLLSIVVAIPLNLATKVQLGLGRGDRAFRWQTLGQLLALATLIALATAGASLPTLVAAAVMPPLLGSVANTASVLRDPSLAGSDCGDRPDLAAHIQREGLWFFGLQLSAALAFSADLPLISAILGPKEAGGYAIVQRVFSIIPMSLGLVWAPLWPIYRQALSSGDHQWVRQTLVRSTVAAIAFAALGGFVLALSFGLLTDHWRRPAFHYSGWLVWGFAIWCVIEAAGTALATFLNAASILRYQLATAVAFAAICLPGKAWVAARFGIEPMPWVTIATYALATILPFAWFGRRVLSAAFARTF